MDHVVCEQELEDVTMTFNVYYGVGSLQSTKGSMHFVIFNPALHASREELP